MKLFGIIERDNNKNIGFELNYDKNIIHFLRKTSHDILLFFNILYSMKSDVLEKINYIYVYDKFIQNIILNNKNDTKNISLSIDIPTLQVKEYLKVISNVIIITEQFNNGNILLNNQNYNIDIINTNDTILLNTNYLSQLGKSKIKILIKLTSEFKENINLQFPYFKVSNNYPLGNIIIQPKFIHMYYCFALNIPISDIFNDYHASKYPQYICEDYNSSDDEDNYLKSKTEDIEKIQKLLYIIKVYRQNNIRIKNITEFKNTEKDECPICYCSDSKSYSIKICRNNHSICNLCLLKIFKNELSHSCPICRENIYFEHEKHVNINHQKKIDFFRNRLNHINFFMY